MKKLIMLAIMFLVATGSLPSNRDVIEKRFNAKAGDFERLTNMIEEESVAGPCFSVANNNVGNYWRYFGRWSSNRDSQHDMSVDDVLEAAGISQERYAEYRKLLRKTRSKKITYCGPSYFYILVHSAGWVTTGCSLDVVKGLRPPAAYGRREEGDKFLEIRHLKEGWWMAYACH